MAAQYLFFNLLWNALAAIPKSEVKKKTGGGGCGVLVLTTLQTDKLIAMIADKILVRVVSMAIMDLCFFV